MLKLLRKAGRAVKQTPNRPTADAPPNPFSEMMSKKFIDKNRKHVTLVYGSGSGFSGQRFAIELIAQGLHERGWQVKIITTPLLDRVQFQSRVRLMVEKTILLMRLLVAWSRGVPSFVTSGISIISPGQTKFALIRDGLPVLVKGLFSSNNPIVISLHGNLIMNLSPKTLEVKILRHLARAACYVTVLGPNQKAQLTRLGIPTNKVTIVDNTCSLIPVTDHELERKHANPQPLKVLYLSSLIEAKGYPEFLEAIAKLSRETDCHIQAVLCGKITTMDADKRFATIEQAKLWIEAKIDEINRSSTVQIRWIDGATGILKESLFREAHVFVLPSHYKVEAQPIAIIEALASGCAVITSNIGEIPTMVSSQTAQLLNNPTAATIAQAIQKFQNKPDKRRNVTRNGLKLFKERFSYKKYIDNWEKLLLSLEGDI